MKRFIATTKSLSRLQQGVCLAGFVVLVSLWSVDLTVCAEEIQSDPSAAAQDQRLEQMKSQGPNATLTILPVRVADKPMDRVTELVGLLLEQKGLKNIELGTKAFDPAQAADLQQFADALGKFVRENPITTDYALYVEYSVKLEQGLLTGIRTIFVDKQGALVWSEQLSAEDEALQKLQAHHDLMSLSVDVVERLAPQLGLNEETSRAARPGNMARIMDERSGLPPEAERAAMPTREEQMRETGPTLKMLVLPPRIMGQTTDTATAQTLANQLNNAALCQAKPAEQVVKLTASQKGPNESKVLWDLAREVRDRVRQHPPDTDYVLCADYVFNPRNWQQGYVHFVVCDRQGEWVIVDMQNSHHEDYGSIRPISREDCGRLLVKRLEGRLQTDKGGEGH